MRTIWRTSLMTKYRSSAQQSQISSHVRTGLTIWNDWRDLALTTQLLSDVRDMAIDLAEAILHFPVWNRYNWWSLSQEHTHIPSMKDQLKLGWVGISCCSLGGNLMGVRHMPPSRYLLLWNESPSFAPTFHVSKYIYKNNNNKQITTMLNS